MTLVPMRFKGLTWHHNPRVINFECDKQIAELKAPFGTAYIQNMGRKNIKISGTGELFGSDCLEQFEKLLDLFKSGGCGVLAIAHIAPVFAVFESIKIIGEPKPDVLTYSFVFREVMELKKAETPDEYVTKQSETLWDISFAFDIVIDELVRLNPWVKRPDEITVGSVVKLC